MFIVVSRETADAQLIKKLAHLFGLGFVPFKIRSVKFYAFVSHLGDRAHGTFRVLFEGITNGIEFQANGNGARRSALERPGKHRA